MIYATLEVKVEADNNETLKAVQQNIADRYNQVKSVEITYKEEI